MTESFLTVKIPHHEVVSLLKIGAGKNKSQVSLSAKEIQPDTTFYLLQRERSSLKYTYAKLGKMLVPSILPSLPENQTVILKIELCGKNKISASYQDQKGKTLIAQEMDLPLDFIQNESNLSYGEFQYRTLPKEMDEITEETDKKNTEHESDSSEIAKPLSTSDELQNVKDESTHSQSTDYSTDSMENFSIGITEEELLAARKKEAEEKTAEIMSQSRTKEKLQPLVFDFNFDKKEDSTFEGITEDELFAARKKETEEKNELLKDPVISDKDIPISPEEANKAAEKINEGDFFPDSIITEMEKQAQAAAKPKLQEDFEITSEEAMEKLNLKEENIANDLFDSKTNKTETPEQNNPFELPSLDEIFNA